MYKKQTSAQLIEQTQHNQRKYQQQPQVNLFGKDHILQKPRTELKLKELRQIRYWKDVGRGIRTPKEAIWGVYVDESCPFTSDIRIRGRLFKGIIKTTKMKRTVVARKNYLHYVKKYRRFERRHKNISIHCSPCFRPSVGDTVIFGECRPIAKTVRHNVLKVLPKGGKRKMFAD